MSSHTETYKRDVSEIIREAERKLGEKYEENVSLGRQSLIRVFLDAVVSCGELTEINRRRMEENPDLKEWFQQPTEMDMDMEGEEDEVFRGRTTFPEEKCEQTNDFIVDYIEQEWSHLTVRKPSLTHPLFNHNEKRYIIYLCGTEEPGGWPVSIILHAHPEPLPLTPVGTKSGCVNTPGTISGTYSDGIPYQRDLRGKKFKELDELLCIL